MAIVSDASRLLGGRVRAARQRTGLTQMDFALLVGMNVAHLGRIERGEGNPNLETLVRLAGALDLDVGDLVMGIRPEHFPPLQPTYSARDFIREREKRRA